MLTNLIIVKGSQKEIEEIENDYRVKLCPGMVNICNDRIELHFRSSMKADQFFEY